MSVRELFAYLCVADTGAAIRFYEAAFGATEKFRLTEPGGRIGHAEIDLGGHTVMLCDEFPEYGIRAPQAGAAAPVTIHLHVDDADAVIARAVEAGATLERPPGDAFYGERSGSVFHPVRAPLADRPRHRGRAGGRDAAPLRRPAQGRR